MEIKHRLRDVTSSPAGRLLLALFLLGNASLCFAEIVADNADNDPYPEHFNPGDNGGTGFTPWVTLEGGTPGSMYTAAAIDGGSYSWGMSGTYALGRGFSITLDSGLWSMLAVHDTDNTAFSGFNLRSSTDIGGGFGDFELLRFGMDPADNTGIFVSTNSGANYDFIDCGWVDGGGDTIEYAVSWNSGGTYSLAVSNLSESGVATFFSGDMTTGSVAMVGAAVLGATANESLTFDEYNVIPEPATTVLLLMGTGLVCAIKRRAQARRH